MGTGYKRVDVTNNIADGNVINASDIDAEYDAIAAAFDASTGHTHDGTPEEGGPITKVGPTQDLEVTAAALLPKTDNTLDLGSSTYEFKDLYIDGTANIDSLVADTADINGGSVDGVTLGTNSPVTNAQIDNININGNVISSTDTNGNIDLTPNGTGEVNITKVDIDAGTIDGTTIGGASAAAGTFTTATATTVNSTTVDTTDLEVTNIKAKDGTASASIADTTGYWTFSGTGAFTTPKGNSTTERPGTPVTGMLRYNTTTNEFEGYSGSSPSWKSVGGAAISNDTSTATDVYPAFLNATSGTASTVYTSNAKLLYKPSTGEFKVEAPIATNGIVLNSTTVASSYTIASGVNGMSIGPITVNSGVTVTVSSGQRWLVL